MDHGVFVRHVLMRAGFEIILHFCLLAYTYRQFASSVGEYAHGLC